DAKEPNPGSRSTLTYYRKKKVTKRRMLTEKIQAKSLERSFIHIRSKLLIYQWTHFTLSDNYAPGIPYQKQEENTHLVKTGTFPFPKKYLAG
ncbi:unnamed protein product, partial [marine sediment metagenome]